VQRISVVGNSGSGKTTLARKLAEVLATAADPAHAHLEFVRLRSQAEADEFLRAASAGA